MDNSNAANNNPNNNIVRNWLTGIAIGLVVVIGITFALHRKDTLSPVIAGDMSSSTDSGASTTSDTTDSGAMTDTTGNASTPSTADTTTSGAFMTLKGTMTTPAAGEAVSASDQSAGSAVAVASMKLTRTSWVAVVAENGSILGAGIFSAAATSGTIPLERETVSGEKYEVVIYADDGDKAFDFHKDLLVVGTDGTPVSSAFTAQ